MELKGFSIRVPEGVELPEGYVGLEHNTKYTLVLHNTRSTRCDVRVEIDGKHIGTWRIEQQASITLERPAYDAGRFTFYRIGTVEASKVGLRKGDPKVGLVKVTFTPEQQYELDSLESQFTSLEMGKDVDAELESIKASLLGPGNASSFSAGGTGLSGSSNQQFSERLSEK